jgi:hypothetical protein
MNNSRSAQSAPIGKVQLWVDHRAEEFNKIEPKQLKFDRLVE